MHATETILTLRTPCVCGSLSGWVKPTSGQDVVRCLSCDSFQYNAPRSETGKPRRTVRRSPVPPKIRWAIAERARGRCEVCGCADPPSFHVGHLLSYADGVDEGFTEAELLDIENLIWLCEECNLGNLTGSVHPTFWLALVRRRANRG